MGAAAARFGPLVVALLLAYWTLGYNLYAARDSDLFLHLAVGESVLATGEVPRVDTWSATAEGRPFVAHEWLAGVAFARVLEGFGGEGLSALRALCGLLVLLAIGLALPRATRARAYTLPFVVVALFLVFARMSVRPHLFTLVFVAVTVAALERFRTSRRALVLVALVPLQVLWANLHGGHVIGPLLLLVAAVAVSVEAMRQRAPAEDAPPWRLRDAAALALVAVAALVAGLCNPYGAGLYRFAAELFFDADYIRAYVSEWMPSWSRVHDRGLWYEANLAWLCALVLVLVLRGALLRGRRLDLVDVALALTVVALDLRAARFVPYAALVGLPILLRSVGPLVERALPEPAWRRRPLLEAAALFALLAFTLQHGTFHGDRPHRFGPGLEAPPYAALLEEAKRAGAEGAVFAEYDVGGWLVWRGGPALRPVIDGRIDVYGRALAEEYFAAREDPVRLLPYLARHDVALVLLRNPGPATKEAGEALLESGKWRLARAIPGWVMFARRER